MYPTISDFINDVFGIDLQLPIQTYGLFLLLAFVTGYLVMINEMKRKEKQGLFESSEKKVLKGAGLKPFDLLITGVLGFIIGYKFVDILFHYSIFVNQPQAFVLTTSGNIWGGIVGLVVSIFISWRSKNKEKLAAPIWVTKKMMPHKHAIKIVIIAGFFGLLGTKIFNDLENWETLISNPWETIFSFNGMSFLGGLIVGGIAVIIYAKRNKIAIIHLLDVAALFMPIAYGVGRMGCQIAGDGCWGVYNEAYATPNAIPQVAYDLGQVASYKLPNWLGFLPDWLVAYQYPHNVINNGVTMADCTWSHCHILSAPVFPTPLYETVLMFIIFGVLFYFRKKIRMPGMLFALYLIFAGLERFFIEKIRINRKYTIGTIEVTQAEIISFLMVLVGIITILILYRNRKRLILK